ncbi:MAG: hypothetical protein A2268_07310 [Candidatus Raymondbacteria bacterium RifOxyA12_full_50_37]|uniref:4Fe-4S ferredoxin-type domain-containing protein n=1 Tax=Candidatus Raymondbacteria bacterium RIFOXYD12_FULL_49_13 TaxID=1817890 RepID=A0A1F7FEE5_UNCRA|nr:MAG: hypothetical protein A2350_11250 [Candidatus Raymondbacteria bacterium RifOxyB12_full_50_8]OGJ89782.1 MAG: hypothetical protein A2268_07310 [Candidatus Raymondbacteria bacterium RifOxyA12_full_50_37]OGJ91190.1 MAG: hypothetical protein A2248_01455 [Candidatus Raymondbacteria bacterium RIFOXYA2_FULL_49_16]OGJ97588.1 MAG: hypothetical protein A2453_02220 [Candidatus Raymondbacteria bacterium RIFOXYC2_FULL_50_21]OGK05060.1 MAG: hypothetical protein A2519_10340 [Candidatus Raymondbacteria b
MKRAMINPRICSNCDLCDVLELCEKKAVFKEDKTDKPWVDFYFCSGCLKCKLLCKNKAVEEIVQPCNGQEKLGW